MVIRPAIGRAKLLIPSTGHRLIALQTVSNFLFHSFSFMVYMLCHKKKGKKRGRISRKNKQKQKKVKHSLLFFCFLLGGNI